eukprot:TRINITY_DN107973_c0_g1_i2.p1 TRINITY_DN107973_c0_g1~~TRINITY_DN107973_c0_g1_i2.p1  ORF type:complete len:103 (-),score=15.38 TRINITY_DN107973_c0_g1_i2:19-327(-)
MPPWMIGWRMPKSSVMRVFMVDEGGGRGRETGRGRSPAFHVRTQVELEGPGVARLRVQVPVVLGDVLGVQDAVLRLQRVALGEIGRAVQQECRDRSRMPSSA